MKLKSIQVQNYRSILKTQSLPLDDGLTVILGPNNEGKSNLLRAIVLAMACLRAIQSPLRSAVQPGGKEYFRLLRGAYDWEADFPQKLQGKEPNGQTILSLEFVLSDAEQINFKTECGSAINGNLPLEIRVSDRGAQFKVKKPGRGGKSYGTKSRQIARYVGRTFEFQYIPAIRPSQLSLEVVGGLIERELSILSDDPAYKAAIQTIEDLQRPVFARLGGEVQTHLKHLLPSVKAVRIGSGLVDNPRGRFRFPEFIVDDGTATPLEAKGDGIKSLAAISLMRASKAGGAAGNLVVAIEEPESHLHPGAARQLAIVLQDMANEHQVIITTHSPLLVARNRLEANIIISKSKVTPASVIKDIRDSLGVQVADNLTNAEYVVLLEGPTDVQILSALFAARSADFLDLIKKGRVVFDHMGGTGSIIYKIRTLALVVASPILIVDDDKAGRESIKKVRLDGALHEKFHFCWKRPHMLETELEDLIGSDVYWDSIQQEFGAILNRAVFDASTDKWSVRMRAAFESAGKPWSSSLESNVKTEVARCVTKNPAGAVAPERELLVDNVISAVVKLMT